MLEKAYFFHEESGICKFVLCERKYCMYKLEAREVDEICNDDTDKNYSVEEKDECEKDEDDSDKDVNDDDDNTTETDQIFLDSSQFDSSTAEPRIEYIYVDNTS